ncbi:MAG: ABC transporter transmembrane domain-containing protein [Pseudomonadota bacterium]
MVRKPEYGADMIERSSSKSMGALRQLWPFLRPYQAMTLAAFATLILTAAVSLILPIAVRRVVDNFDVENGAILDRYFLAAIGLAGLLAIGTGLRYALVTRLGERAVADIRKAVFDRIISLSPAFYERTITGEVLSRLTTDTTLILSVVGSSVSVALRNVLIFVGGLVLMLFTSAKLSSLVLLLVPLIIAPIIIMGRKLRRLSRESQDWIASSSGNASEALLNVQTIQAFTHEKASQEAFSEITEQSYDVAKQRISVRAWLTILVIFMVFTGIVGVLWIGARDVRADVMSAGTLIQFVIYSIMVAGAVAALSEIWGELQRASGATERLVELLEAKDEVQDPASPVVFSEPVSGRIVFENVTFQYPTRPDQSALQALNLVIEPGETIAIVGPSGSGKTTITNMIQRFYDPNQGTVSIDGVDMRDLARSDLRANLSLVPQEPVIFAASAMENIRFGNLNATNEEVRQAALAAAAHEFIEATPEGYDTFLGERGMMLSGGQKQRIAIARAILRNASVLLLDEATSALDAESESAVQKAVDEMSKNRTTVIVAHRLATVKKADRIIVMEQGKIVAEGTHNSLVSEGGLYARLARLQFTDGKAA